MSTQQEVQGISQIALKAHQTAWAITSMTQKYETGNYIKNAEIGESTH